MANGDEELLLSSRTDFMKSVGLLAEHLEGRVGAIRESMATAAAQTDGRSKLFEEVWLPKLDSLEREIRDVRRRAAMNPTLCVMGKRGQGKTSLLSKWLAGNTKSTDVSNPLSAILNLPTGASDTTAALIRLRALRPNDPQYDERFLYCTMLDDSYLAQLPAEKRPPGPSVKELRVVRNGPPAYWVCRFPNPDFEKTHRLVIDQAGIASVTEGAEGKPLAEVQWHAREVLVPFDLSRAPVDSLGTKTLGVLDIIDAPGADAMVQGDFPEWKRKKNSLVFEAAIRELDVLFLIASSDISAIQLGGQFQEDIWWKWLDRCRDDADMAGRLVMAFTKSVQLFSDAERRVTGDESTNNDINNFATRICKNVLEGLASHRDGVPQLLRAKDPGTWPPMFFFEKDDAAIARFREGISPGQGPALASEILSRLFASPTAPREGLPLGGQCIYEMASDILKSEQITHAGRKPVVRWIVHALCRLLDPADMGYKALTDLIHAYATGGPVALKYANERKRYADEIADRFRALLGDLATPAGNQKALHDLETVQGLLRAYWADSPEGPRLYRGPLCHRRRDHIRVNRNQATIGTTTHVVNHDMVLDDVARDAVEQMRGKKHPWTRDQAEMVARVLHACLKGDGGLQEMGVAYRQAIDTDYEALQRVQTVALERLVRILAFLVNASKDDLGRVASHCFQINLDEAELVAALNRDVVMWNSDDESRLAAVEAAHASLRNIIERIPCEKPYESVDS